MSTALVKTTPRKRTASKQARQQQLIKATIRSIARNGLSTTTMATVSSEAGLSQGIINLHFKSKERLLIETLCFVADEYKAAWEKALQGSGDDPADKLAALVRVDFEKRICQRNKLAVWFAFWGESKSRPTYRNICAERDREYRKVLNAVCAQLIKQGKYTGLNSASVGFGLSAMCEGLWLDLLISPKYMNPDQAEGICMDYLKTVFPKHF